jgi:hypothetical protein
VQDAQKMNVFLGFMFNEQTLNKWLKDEWCKLFDENYVVDTLIGRLMRGKGELQVCGCVFVRVFVCVSVRVHACM